MGFYPEQALAEGLFRKHNPMRYVVGKLSDSAKKAMYAAASRGMIARGTWNGCAFNKAGIEHRQAITNTQAAADLFNMRETDVSRFISTWDALDCDDVQANRYLIEAIEESFQQPQAAAVKGRRVIRGYAFKSEATKWGEQLESGELTVDMIPGCHEIAALLSA